MTSFLGVSKMSNINTSSTGEEHHECLERSEGCEGSLTKLQRNINKFNRHAVTRLQRHGRHGCDEGVLMPLDEKFFTIE
jgi:hypothetical protein